jgi:hypothetical protein
MATALLCNPKLLRKIIVQGGPKYKDLLALPPQSFPRVSRLAVLYGFLGRHTPIRNPQVGDSEGPPHVAGRVWNWCVHLGLTFVLDLYDSQNSPGSPSTLTDFTPEEIVHFPKETLLICGTRDPLLASNIAAQHLLMSGGHFTELHLFPTNHAFHGFPPNWHNYLGSNWKEHALPAQVLLSKFLTNGNFDDESYQRAREQQDYISDRSPLVIFPLLFSIFPVVAYVIARSMALNLQPAVA